MRLYEVSWKLLLESFRSTFRSKLWLENRSFETFNFLDRHRLSTEKVNMFAAILNYTENGGPLSQTQTVAERSVSSLPNGLVVTGARYPEHPYQLYPWINPVPYLFIFRTKTLGRLFNFPQNYADVCTTPLKRKNKWKFSALFAIIKGLSCGLHVT